MRQNGFGGLCVSGRSLHNAEPHSSPTLGMKQGTLQLTAQNVLFHNTMPGALLVPSSHAVSKPLHRQRCPPQNRIQRNAWVSDQKACKQRDTARYPPTQTPAHLTSRARKTQHTQLHQQPHGHPHSQTLAHSRSQSANSHTECRKLRYAAAGRTERPQAHEATMHQHDASRSESAPGSAPPSRS